MSQHYRDVNEYHFPARSRRRCAGRLKLFNVPEFLAQRACVRAAAKKLRPPSTRERAYGSERGQREALLMGEGRWRCRAGAEC